MDHKHSVMKDCTVLQTSMLMYSVELEILVLVDPSSLSILCANNECSGLGRLLAFPADICDK